MTGALILVIVLGFFARRAGQTVDTVRQSWQPVSWVYLVLSFASFLICLFIMALLWYGILRTMGGRLPLSTALRFYGLTLLPRYVPGSVWGYAGRTLLCEREGVERRVAAGSAVVEVGLIVGSAFIVVLMEFLDPGWILLVLLPAVIMLLGFLFSRLLDCPQKAVRFRRSATWYGWGLAYLGFWLMYGASSWLVASSVSPKVDTGHVLAITVRSTAAWLAGFLAIVVPGGLGVREGVFALILTPIVGPAGGVFIPLLARLTGMLAELVFFLTSILFFRGRTGGDALQSLQDPPGSHREAGASISSPIPDTPED